MYIFIYISIIINSWRNLRINLAQSNDQIIFDRKKNHTWRIGATTAVHRPGDQKSFKKWPSDPQDLALLSYLLLSIT